MNVSRKKILLAEDEKAYSRAFTLKLQNAGYDVENAFDGEEVLEKFRDGKFDLLVLDLIMPKLNGFQVLQQIGGKKNGLKILVVSNLGQDEDEEKSLKLGADMFLSKSNTPIAEVLSKITSLLN